MHDCWNRTDCIESAKAVVTLVAFWGVLIAGLLALRGAAWTY